MRSTPNGIFIIVRHAPIQKGRILIPLADPFVIIERMQAHGMTQREVQELWGLYLAAVSAKLCVHLDQACKDVSRAFYYAAHPPGAECFFQSIDGRPLDLSEFDSEIAAPSTRVSSVRPDATRHAAQSPKDKPGAGLTKFAAKYGKTFLLANAIETQASDKVRGRATAVDGIVVECPFDEFHTNSGDAEDKASFVINGGVTDAGGFVWKCHHASCQGRDRTRLPGQGYRRWLVRRPCLRHVRVP